MRQRVLVEGSGRASRWSSGREFRWSLERFLMGNREPLIALSLASCNLWCQRSVSFSCSHPPFGTLVFQSIPLSVGTRVDTLRVVANHLL